MEFNVNTNAHNYKKSGSFFLVFFCTLFSRVCGKPKVSERQDLDHANSDEAFHVAVRLLSENAVVGGDDCRERKKLEHRLVAFLHGENLQ